MKYNREWIDGVHETWKIIRSAPMDVVPFHHRALIKQQFDIQIQDFKNQLAGGLDTKVTQNRIADLVVLAYQLIDEAEQWQSEHAVGIPTYGPE